MNISSFNILVADNGWEFIRRLHTSYQYKNLFTGRIITITIPDASCIPDDAIRRLKNKFN